MNKCRVQCGDGVADVVGAFVAQVLVGDRFLDRGDADRCECVGCAEQERCAGCSFLVGQDLGVGEPGMTIDE